MIDKSFIFLDKVGHQTEQSIWTQNIHTWDDFIETKHISGISPQRKTIYNLNLQKAKRNLEVKNHPFFTELFPKQEHWRLYNTFKDDALYVDIETSQHYGDITVLGLHSESLFNRDESLYNRNNHFCEEIGNSCHMMIKGKNMDKELFKQIIKNSKMIVTFNGSSFDIPIIEKHFGMNINLPHIDLRHVCAKIGLTGGLKSIEQQIGIQRDQEVTGVCGSDAIYLWNMYKMSGDEKYLEKLILYNREDIVNLKPLAEFAIPKLWELRRNGFC